MVFSSQVTRLLSSKTAFCLFVGTCVPFFISQTLSKSESEVARLCPTLCDPMDCSPPSVLGIFPGKNTGMGCHFLLQGIFPTQGLKLGLPHCGQTLYHLSHQGIPCVPFFISQALSKSEVKIIHFLSHSPTSCVFTKFP